MLVRLLKSTSEEGLLHDAPPRFSKRRSVLRGLFGEMGVNRFKNFYSRFVHKMSVARKSVNCSCGSCIIDPDGKAIRRTVITTDGDSLFALCLKCKGHTRLGKFEACDPPQREEPAARKSRLRIVYMPKYP